MKFTISAFCYPLFCLLITGGSSCNHYLDKATAPRKIHIIQSSLVCYPDSNILIFKSKVGIKMDNEKYNARPFYAKLPKGLISYQFSNAEDLALYYKKGQAIAIVIDLSDSTSKENTSCEPTKSEIDKYLIHFTSDKKQKFNMRRILYYPERKHLIIKRGAATILLYNILPDNNDLFISCVENFKFL